MNSLLLKLLILGGLVWIATFGLEQAGFKPTPGEAPVTQTLCPDCPPPPCLPSPCPPSSDR